MEEENGILTVLEIQFADLVALASSPSSSCVYSPPERLESMSKTIMKTLGPGGHGLLAVTGVPKARENSRKLLGFARKLALLDDSRCRRILKEHGLGTDVPLKNPDRNVSAYTMQLKYSGLKTNSGAQKPEEEVAEIPTDYVHEVDTPDCEVSEFRELGDAFKDLGFCMMELGLLLAKVCDKAIGIRELECSMLESCSAKGRLIHYHSSWDRFILKERIQMRSIRKAKPRPSLCQVKTRKSDVGKQDHDLRRCQTIITSEDVKYHEAETKSRDGNASLSGFWQKWHYDYGIFTVLTSPIFSLPHEKLIEDGDEVNLDGQVSECCLVDGHTCLQILDPVSRKILLVRTPPNSFIIQVGEAAEILSDGKLRSTNHAVHRPLEKKSMSRETFVVFLQPAWDKALSSSGLIPVNPLSQNEYSELRNLCSFSTDGYNLDHTTLTPDVELSNVTYEIQKMVPPLSTRFKEGMTFAEFSRVTTSHYYGGKGLQSER